MNQQTKTNQVYLYGEIVEEATFSHEVYGEGFYEMKVRCERLSGQYDILPITISERLIENGKIGVGQYLNAIGQFRSYNKLVDGKSKLMLTVFIRELLNIEPQKNPNLIVLTGYVCKEPIYRTTPFNREIADLLVAVNRSYNKSDYVPCIAWGRNARFVKNIGVGERVSLVGRIQSREYQKKIGDDEVKTLTAYEVSINKISAYENVKNFNFDDEFKFLEEIVEDDFCDSVI